MASYISYFVPHPVNIYITEYTFIRYKALEGVKVGLITKLDVISSVAEIRCFMSWADLVTHVGVELLQGISFWADYKRSTPTFLCDTDITKSLPFDDIVGIAFVFHVDDPVLDSIQGIRDTYQVSSMYCHGLKTIYHTKTFTSFPSQMIRGLPTCFPSSLFKEILTIKQKIQICLSTASKNDTFTESCRMDNINTLTWLYLIRDLPVDVMLEENNAVVKRTFFQDDMYVLQKRRCLQQSFHLYSPDHLRYAQMILGSFAGIGSRKKLKCSITQRHLSARAEQKEPLRRHEEHNVVPFEWNNEVEYIRRGITFKYIRDEQILMVTVRFRKVIHWGTFQEHLRERNITSTPEDDANNQRYPFHYNMELLGKKLHAINLDARIVSFTDRSTAALNDIIIEINRILN